MGIRMVKRVGWACVAVVLLSSLTLAQGTKATAKAAGGGPDKAHLQKIWDAWSTLDPANAAQFYASGPHVFFDIAPLKYGSWEEYQKGVVAVLAPFLWLLQMSLKTQADIFAFPPKLVFVPTLEHYRTIWDTAFRRSFTNSAVVAVLSTALVNRRLSG